MLTFSHMADVVPSRGVGDLRTVVAGTGNRCGHSMATFARRHGAHGAWWLDRLRCGPIHGREKQYWRETTVMRAAETAHRDRVGSASPLSGDIAHLPHGCFVDVNRP